MITTRRYKVFLDGTGGVFAIDYLQGTTRYVQVPSIKDDNLLIYEGVRLVVPVILSEDLKTVVSPPPTWSALKPLEAVNRVVFIVVSRSVEASDAGRKQLSLFSELTKSALGWELLPLVVDNLSMLDETTLFNAAMEALQDRWLGQADSPFNEPAGGLQSVLRIPRIDAGHRSEIAVAVAKEYALKDYGRKRLASFVEYYTDNPLSVVVNRARQFAEKSIDGGQLEAMISDALVSMRPFSFVRVGEGEGCYLSYAKYLANRIPKNEVFGVCAKDIYKIWFDRNIHDVAQQELEEIRNLFWQAMRSADVIGMPTPGRVIYEQAHFITDIGLHGYSRGYVGISEVLNHIEKACHREDLIGKIYTDCDIARPLYEWQDWSLSLATTLPRILKDRREVTFITCHSGLAPALQTFLNLKQVRTLAIPPERGRVKGETHLEGDHYRDYFHRICDELQRDSSPLVIVAAGFLGKAYCSVARNAGSVAIDIGSLADYWVGANTRQKNAWSILSPFVMT